ncbi:S9 family peptidase [Pseudanabaena sp. PCC 6802]|uniref:S9 family peptidase n=1 Tax=Pseudanabaena sp. PCC 6802 TaxID=118173 RepID=UPI0003451C95|nr:S9 family peptidase [Pseudanabaena sp. PCC 6802]
MGIDAKKVAPYGAWKSPITSELIVSTSIGLGQVALVGTEIYWSESRPSEGGRNAIVRYAHGQTADVLPLPYNARSRVHEYGGGSFLVVDGKVYFANFADQRIYCQWLQVNPNNEPTALTSAGAFRYADGVFDRVRNRLIYVREEQQDPNCEPINTLVSINVLNGEDVKVLARGADFYAAPQLNADGTKLAWLSWNHPNMPWDGTELWVADLAETELHNCQLVAGGMEESIFQPQWSPHGVLHFVSDRSGWWNLYRWHGDRIEPLCKMEAEFGMPQWVFGMSTYAFLSSDRIICAYNRNGEWQLATLDTSGSGQSVLTPIPTPYTDISSLQAHGDRAVFIAGSPTEPTAIVQLDLNSDRIEVLRSSTELQVDKAYLSIPQTIEFPTENGQTAYAFFYPPTNGDFVAPNHEKPPLLVKSHGGPTAAASSSFSLRTQYWTSRGFAILDVNYGGSTGYGRAYRQRLHNNWGIVDVDDCANGAKYLADRGLVDGNRLAISGGSAGGYTTLCALTFKDIFKAGASYYGVSDLEALASDTHKFEARYLDGLIGAYPERKDLYVARSPIHFTEQLSCPVIFFQGLEDRVVPPNQAEMMVDALRTKGLPVAYVAFAGEQHGFRKAENIKRALDGEFYFYSRIFGFEPADILEPVEIDRLD